MPTMKEKIEEAKAMALADIENDKAEEAAKARRLAAENRETSRKEAWELVQGIPDRIRTTIRNRPDEPIGQWYALYTPRDREYVLSDGEKNITPEKILPDTKFYFLVQFLNQEGVEYMISWNSGVKAEKGSLTVGPSSYTLRIKIA